MHPYLPVLFIIIFGFALGLILSSFSALLGPKKPTSVKSESFECGVPQVTTRDRISVKFYLTSILFILFDIETVFLYLWAKGFKTLGWFGIAEILVFVAILVVGYVYVLRRGALEWD